MKHCLLPNQEVRAHAKKSGVRIYEIADALHLSQATITRRLRYELPSEDTQIYLAAIDTIAERRATENSGDTKSA